MDNEMQLEPDLKMPAADPLHTKIKALFDLIGLNALITERIDEHVKDTRAAWALVYSKGLPDAQTQHIDLIAKTMKDNIYLMMGGIVDIFKLHYDESDIDTMIAFFGSPTGKKYMASCGKILEDINNLNEEWKLAMHRLVEPETTVMPAVTQPPPPQAA
jgi:hypothetical protein